MASVLVIPEHLLRQVSAHVEGTYPEEGAGFLLGSDGVVREVFPLSNAREEGARHNRYLISPEDYLKAEKRAAELGMDLVGVFHSHPDCPNVPSEYDREWAQPFFSYLITRVERGRVVSHRSWRLAEDRSRYDEEALQVT